MANTAAVIAAPSSAAAGKTKRRYDISKDSFRSAVDVAILDALCDPVEFYEKQRVRLKPAFSTACWSYLPPHNIYIGTDLFEKDCVKLGLADELCKKYIANHYHHERGHALYTVRDLEHANQELSAIGCPFQLFNLFEDARIEDRYRRTTGYRFEWTMMEDLSLSARPECLLFALIQLEGDTAKYDTLVDFWEFDLDISGKPDGPVKLDAAGVREASNTKEALLTWKPKVLSYYERMLAADESLALLPLLKAWIDEFGLPPPPPPGAGDGMPQDLQLGQALQSDAKVRAKFDSNCSDIDDENGKPPPLYEEPDNGSEEPVSQKGRVLSSEQVAEIDKVRVAAVVAKFMRFFKTNIRHQSSRTPNKRVSPRHFAAGRAPFRKKEIEGRGPAKIVIFVDCSGSMRGFPIAEGLVIVAALSELARRGHVIGHVVFTGVSSGPIHETYEFPVNESVLKRVDGRHNGEGVEAAIRLNAERCKDARYVFFYTDGNLSDRTVDKSKLHAQGIKTWGLYAGTNEEYIEKLMLYFDRAILRPDAEALVDAILAENR